jgi:flagellum-specific ATP synthase
MAIYRKNQDLINIGAYPAGTNPVIDLAKRLNEPLNKFLIQAVGLGVKAAQSWDALGQVINENSKKQPNKPQAAKQP